jgi:hypothetical protein
MTTQQRSGPRASAPRSGRSTSRFARPDGGVNARARYERYVELARAAGLAGDVVEAENYNQHAEHYFRVMRGQTE